MSNLNKIESLYSTNTNTNRILAINLAQSNNIDISELILKHISIRDNNAPYITNNYLKKSNVVFGVSKLLNNHRKILARDYKFIKGERFNIKLLIFTSERNENHKTIYDYSTPICWEYLCTNRSMDLSKYIVEKPLHSNSSKTIKIWDYKKMVEEIPQLKLMYDNVKARIVRKTIAYYKLVDLPKFKIENRTREYGYLSVDNETSFYGNYIINEIKSCKMAIIKSDEWNPITFLKNQLTGIDTSQTIEEQITSITNAVKDYNFVIKCEKPYRVCLSGSDDFSLNKGFWTLEEAEVEVMYLATIQPINDADIQKRGFYND